MYNKKYIIFTILIIFIILKYRSYFINNYENKNTKKELDLIFKKIDSNIEAKNNSIIPKTIFQTYMDKNKIPNKVNKNFEKYAKGYKRIVYNDNEALKFLHDNFGKIFFNKFKSMKLGAHKADLLRYCYLYVNGGIYIDIKTELLVDLDTIIKERKDRLYTVLCFLNLNTFTNLFNTIYQGFIAVPPRNFFIKKIIYKYMYMSDSFINFNFLGIPFNYFTFCEQFYKLIYNYTKKRFLKADVYKIKNFSFELFQEINDCSNNKIKDRYGYCVTIRDKNNRILMNCRYSDFPW